MDIILTVCTRTDQLCMTTDALPALTNHSKEHSHKNLIGHFIYLSTSKIHDLVEVQSLLERAALTLVLLLSFLI
jgi:hypothetical protein